MTTAGLRPSERGRRLPGEAGTWVFILGDLVVFGAFPITFMVQRSSAPELFDAARRTLHTGIGLANTLILLTSSLCVVIYLGTIRAGALSIARRYAAAAILCGLAFVGLKVTEYFSLAGAGHTIGDNNFYLYYYILTGLHLFHVGIGLVVLLLLLLQVRRTDLSQNRIALVEGGACFWHLVDLLWIMLFALLYLTS